MRTSSMETRTGWLAAMAAVIVWTALAAPSHAQLKDKHESTPIQEGHRLPADAFNADLPPHPVMDTPWWENMDDSAWVLQPPVDDGAPPAPDTRASNCCPVGGWVQTLGYNPVWTGNVFTINQTRILKEIKIEANFTGPLEISFGIYREKADAPVGDYSALCIKKVPMTGNGRGFYSSGPLQGSSGILLTPKESGGVPVPTFFAVAVGWGTKSIDFRIDEVNYSTGPAFCAGNMRGSWVRTGAEPPPATCPSNHELIGLTFFPTGAISMQLCFEEPGGACCMGDQSCLDDLTSNACAQQGGEFLGLYTICALDAAECTGFGACCPFGGGCAIMSEGACASSPTDGVYKGHGTNCGPPEACSTTFGACCRYDGTCDDQINEYDCVNSPFNNTPGEYQGDFVECELPGTNSLRCEPLGACCDIGPPHGCFDRAEDDCALFNCLNALSTNGTTVCPAGYVEEIAGTCPQAGTQCYKVVRTYSPGEPCSHGACAGEVGACCAMGECITTNGLKCQELGGDFSTNGDRGWNACNEVWPTGCPPATEGACCLPNGNCTILSEADCLGTNGTFVDEGIACSNFICTPGACCHEDAGGQPACIETQPLDCAQNHLNGQYRGAGSVCPLDPEDCFPIGACCFDNGSCGQLTANQCANSNGVYQGEGTQCDDADCPIPGACCVNLGVLICFEESDQECLARPQQNKFFTPSGNCDNGCGNGACCELAGACTEVSGPECSAMVETEFDDGGSCTPNTCAVRGACCTAGGCVTATQAECLDTNGLNGAYRGDGVSCSAPNVCDFAACCNGSTCANKFVTECTGIHGEPGELCQANTCLPGACCIDFEGNGTMICQNNFRLFQCRAVEAAFSQFAGPGVNCASNPCANLPGACCKLDGGCEDLTQTACNAIAGATFQLGETCSTANCPDQTTACCRPDNTCADMTETDCNAITDAVFLSGQECASATCPEFAYGCCELDRDCVDRTPTACAALANTSFHNGQLCGSFTCPDVCGNTINSDFDGDGHVDLLDFAEFQRCVGAGTPECLCPFDANANGTIDVQDAENFIPALSGPQASAAPCSPYQGYAAGDYDNDGDVSLRDFAALQWCTAPGGTLQCRCIFDSNGNALIDSTDLLAWTGTLTGP